MRLNKDVWVSSPVLLLLCIKVLVWCFNLGVWVVIFALPREKIEYTRGGHWLRLL